MLKSFKTLRAAALFLFCLCVFGCNFFPFNYLNFVLAVGDGGAVGAAETELSQTEADLFEDGPLDMPVTIAKLDAPDPSKVSVEVAEVGSPDVNVPLADAGTLYRMTVTGAPGAVGSVAATPFVVAYLIDDFSVDESSQTIVDVAEDGSFLLEMILTLDQQVMFAAMAPDLETTSPFTIIAADQDVIRDEDTGVFIFVTTNTNYLNAAQGIFSDASGYAYLSLAKPDATHTFLRRNVKATDVQTLDDGAAQEVNHVAAVTEDKIAYLASDGGLFLTLPTTEPVAALVKGPLDGVVTSYTLQLDTLDPYDPELTGLAMTADQRGILVTTAAGETAGVKYYRTTSDYKINLVPEGIYDDIVAAPGGDELLFVLNGSDGEYALQRLDLGGSLGRAWTERETLAEELVFEDVVTADASGDALVFDAVESGAEKIYAWSEDGGLRVFRDNGVEATVVVTPRFNPDGTLIVACELGEDGAGNQLVFHKVGVHAEGAFKRLTSNPAFTNCDAGPGSFIVDASGFLHFYRARADGTAPQHAMISLKEL